MQTAMKMALRRPISDPVAGLVWPQPLRLARICADSQLSSHTLHSAPIRARTAGKIHALDWDEASRRRRHDAAGGARSAARC
jgi:YD repeat-containing protein